MTYTVQLDFFIDSDEIMSRQEVEEVVKEVFDSFNCDASNIMVIDIND